MTPIQRTLLAIAALVAIAVGTFIYFIANWDASKAEPIGSMDSTSPFPVSKKSRGLGKSPSPTAQPGHPA